MAIVRNVFAIDARSLAVFRILIGTLLLVDLLIRSSDLTAMYTDHGMFSRAEISQRVTSAWNWSFHFASGEAGFQAALFVVAALLALALIAGYEARLAAIGSWLMLISIQHRVPPILSGADILLRMLLFWGMFLPLSRIWSVDRWLAKDRPEKTDATADVLSVGTAAILLQMGMMYWFSALFKSNPDWLNGGAIKASLAHDFYAKPLGTWLLQYPGMLRMMNWTVYALEWVGPLLLFSPWKTATTRVIGIALLATMHIGIALTMEVDFFSPVAIAGLTLFLPRAFWERIMRKADYAPTPTISPAVLPRRSPWFLAGQAICALLLAYVVSVNLRSVSFVFGGNADAPKPGFLRTACGLGQKWNMFDQAPSKDGWYVAVATLQDGSRVDVLRDGVAVDWRRPERPAALYPNHRWRKLFREMAYEDALGYQYFRRPVIEFLARRWNERTSPEKDIQKLELIYCMEKILDESAKVKSTERERIAELDLSDT